MTAMRAIQKALGRNKPDPVTGYRTGGVGEPVDKSSYDEIRRRWGILKQANKDWIRIYPGTDVMKNSRLPEKAFKHPSSPIKQPGTSMHGAGHALDMAGNSGEIKSICASLGATLICDEPGNFHIEFANGVENRPVQER